MNKALVMLVVLAASAAFGSKVHKTKEPVAQRAENTLHMECPARGERFAFSRR